MRFKCKKCQQYKFLNKLDTNQLLLELGLICYNCSKYANKTRETSNI